MAEALGRTGLGMLEEPKGQVAGVLLKKMVRRGEAGLFLKHSPKDGWIIFFNFLKDFN